MPVVISADGIETINKPELWQHKTSHIKPGTSWKFLLQSSPMTRFPHISAYAALYLYINMNWFEYVPINEAPKAEMSEAGN